MNNQEIIDYLMDHFACSTQVELANKLGCHKQNISQFKRNDSDSINKQIINVLIKALTQEEQPNQTKLYNISFIPEQIEQIGPVLSSLHESLKNNSFVDEEQLQDYLEDVHNILESVVTMKELLLHEQRFYND